jgi:hypothetical protein
MALVQSSIMAPWCQSADRLYSTPESKRTSFPFPTPVEVTHAEHVRPLSMWCLSYRGRETSSWVPFRAGKMSRQRIFLPFQGDVRWIRFLMHHVGRVAWHAPDLIRKSASDPQYIRGATHGRTVSLKVPTVGALCPLRLHPVAK